MKQTIIKTIVVNVVVVSNGDYVPVLDMTADNANPDSPDLELTKQSTAKQVYGSIADEWKYNVKSKNTENWMQCYLNCPIFSPDEKF